MATVIDCGDGRFIAGDPADHLEDGQHWCWSCGGTGLEYSYWGDDEPRLEVCARCDGIGVIDCTDTSCPTHSSLHPQEATRQEIS